MTYYTTKIRSTRELNLIIRKNGGLDHFRTFWPWLPQGDPAEFILDHCHAYRIDSDKMNFVIGTPDPLALFLVSANEFYVFNRSKVKPATARKILENFAAACDSPISTYIPASKKGLIRLSKYYGFKPIGKDYYVKQQTP